MENGALESNSSVGNLPFLRDRRVLILISVILFSRLVLVSIGAQYGSLKGDDGHRYLATGYNIATYHVFSSEIDIKPGQHPAPTAHDMPVYPTILALLIIITGGVILATKVASFINALFFTLAALGVFYLTLEFSKNRLSASIAMIVFGFLPEGLAYSVFYQPDSLFLACFVWSNVFLINYIRQGRAGHMIICFGLLGLSIIVKPIAIFYAVAATAYILFFGQSRGLKERLICLAGSLFLLVLILSPWLIRNYNTFGTPGLTTIGGYNLFYGNYRMMLVDKLGSGARGIVEKKEQETASQFGSRWLNPFVKSKALERVAKREILANMPQYIVTLAKRHWRLYLGTGTPQLLSLLGDQKSFKALSEFGSHPTMQTLKQVPFYSLVLQCVMWLILFAAYLFAALGVYAAIRNRDWLTLGFVFLTLGYFALIIGPVVQTRYRLCMAPYLSVLAGYAWLRIGHHEPT